MPTIVESLHILIPKIMASTRLMASNYQAYGFQIVKMNFFVCKGPQEKTWDGMIGTELISGLGAPRIRGRWHILEGQH